jgi:hypothetical protein
MCVDSLIRWRSFSRASGVSMLPGTSMSSKSTSSARAPVAFEVTPTERMLALRASLAPVTQKRFAPGLFGSRGRSAGGCAAR